MKKIVLKTILICALFVLLICNVCYADLVYMPTVTESTVSIIDEIVDFPELLIVFVPLIIIYVVLVEVLLLRNKKKTKVKKVIVILITLILLIFDIIVYKSIIQNIDEDAFENKTIEKVKYGYVDKDNNIVIEPKEYDYAEEFSNGVARIGYLVDRTWCICNNKIGVYKYKRRYNYTSRI